jgi:5-methylcytosine-specific restriction endonuclease McrA
MVYIVRKNIKTKSGCYPYFYLCKSERHGKKVKHITIKYLGRVEGIEKLENKIIEEVFKRDNYKCKQCGFEEKLVVDHINPLSNGGGNNLENLQILCKACNEHKGKKIP